MNTRVAISVLIPTYNEELNLPECLRNVANWADEIVVLDSGSQDRTVPIAVNGGAQVVHHAFEGYARQKNWALDNVRFRHEWLLILDADERLTPELREEISGIVAGDGNGCDGFYLNRRFIFFGKWLRHCGWYPSWNLRLFRHRLGRYEERQVHEHLVLNGHTGYCREDMIHDDRRDLTFWIEKHNAYSNREAGENLKVLQAAGDTNLRRSVLGSAVERKRAIKDGLWIRMPAIVRAGGFFTYMYFVRMGFLDGVRGLHFCAMHTAFEYFNAIKLWELQQARRADEVALQQSRAA